MERFANRDMWHDARCKPSAKGGGFTHREVAQRQGPESSGTVLGWHAACPRVRFGLRYRFGLGSGAGVRSGAGSGPREADGLTTASRSGVFGYGTGMARGLSAGQVQAQVQVRARVTRWGSVRRGFLSKGADGLTTWLRLTIRVSARGEFWRADSS